MYKYTHLINENIAPIGATKICAYRNGKKVCDIDLGRLKQPTQTKRYSFLALADVHITYDTASTDFQRALTFAESSEDCFFTCVCGDLTGSGNADELSQYKAIVEAVAKTKPVYAIAGNHESYDVYNILQNYTGKPLYYSFNHGNDVFIMVGHAGGWRASASNWVGGEQFTQEELQWLYNTLEDNRDKRCFVFCHVFPYNDGVGNAKGLYTNDNWTSANGTVFENLMKHYKNTILFHGHSHLRFKLQEVDKKANYSSEVGYRSVHIPSLSVPRDIATGGGYETIYAESEGYVVDVYDDCIILNGRDFIDNDADGHIIPIGTYKIDTALQAIPPNTFVDSTGTIIT